MTYDLLILGGGPAGLSAGIYGARARLKTVILEKGAVGGMASTTREIVNYPGFFETISGPDLMAAMATHAKQFGAEIVREEVVQVELEGETKTVVTKKGRRYEAKVVILCPGSEPRLLNIPGEKALRGSGVSYCATCDADCYKGLTVVVVGNGDAAIEEATYITKYADKVIVCAIHDEGIVDCNRFSAEKAFRNEKIEFLWNSVLVGIRGTEEVEAVQVRSLKTGAVSEIKTEGVFIYIGMAPSTAFLKGKVALDDRGYILTNDTMETSLEGVYAVGDARVKYLRQVVTAAADGAIAAVAAETYLAEEDEFRQNVLNADRPVVLAFWSPLDDLSLSALSRIEQLIAQTGDHVGLIKVDVSRKQRLARKYDVTTTPAAFLLDKGKVVRSLSKSPAASELIL